MGYPRPSLKPFKLLAALLYLETPSVSRDANGWVTIHSTGDFILLTKFLYEDLRDCADTLKSWGYIKEWSRSHGTMRLQINKPLVNW